MSQSGLKRVLFALALLIAVAGCEVNGNLGASAPKKETPHRQRPRCR